MNKEKPDVATRRPEVGGVVTYRMSDGTDCPALVTAVHGSEPDAAINVAFLAQKASEHDGYGRRVLRATSVQHISRTSGGYVSWRFVDEEVSISEG